MKSHNTNEQGYTLIEMMIVIAIVGIVLGGSLVSFMSQRKGAVLKSGHASVVQALKTAQSQAVSGVGTTSHGVHIASNKVVVFEGDTYPSSGTEYPLPPGVTLSTSAGSNELVFKRLDGTLQGATVGETITVELSSGENEVITIKDYGFIQ